MEDIDIEQWDKRQKRYQRWNRIFLIIYIGISLAVLARGVTWHYNRATLYSVIALVMLVIPWVVEKLGRLVIPADCRFLYYIFCFAAIELGSALDGYDRISWWDLLLHAASGALLAFLGLFIYNGLRHNQGQIPLEEEKLAIIFMNLLATTAAAFWEYYEFCLDTFFGFNAQYSAAGVTDTMTDMIACTIGGLCLSIWFTLGAHKEKDKDETKGNFLRQTVAHFYVRNRLLDEAEDAKDGEVEKP